MADWNFSELDKLAVDLGDAADVIPNVKKAVQVNSNKVKSAWRNKLQGSSTLPALPYAVSYDVEVNAGGVEGEIGFDKDKPQGALGNVSEYGTMNNAPRGFGLASLEENQADFVEGIEKAIDDTLKAAGL